jgi:hypothetical protein
MPIPEVQAYLRAPGEVDDLTRQMTLPLLEGGADTWWMARMVRGFAEHVA